MARTKAQLEKDRLEAAVIRQRQRIEDAERGKLVTVCSKHEWRVSLNGRPVPPPKSGCPECVREGMGSRAGETYEARTVSLSEQNGESLEMRIAYDQHLERQGGVRPGSIAEQTALDSINAAREEERERDEARKRGFFRGARLAYSSRIENGQLVGTYALPLRAGRS